MSAFHWRLPQKIAVQKAADIVHKPVWPQLYPCADFALVSVVPETLTDFICDTDAYFLSSSTAVEIVPWLLALILLAFW